jgi:1-phosphofructokinase
MSGGSGFLVIALDPRLERTVRLPELEKGEVNRSSEYSFDPAGRGINLARALSHLGEPVTLLTYLGGARRDILLGLLREEGISTEAVESRLEIPTVYTILDATAGSSTELAEAAHPPSRATEEVLEERARRLFPQAQTVVVCGDGSVGWSDELAAELVAAARVAGVRAVVDIPDGELEKTVSQAPDLLRTRAATFERQFGGAEAELTDRGVAVLLDQERGVRFSFPGGVSGSRDRPEVRAVNFRGADSAFTAGFLAEWQESGEPDAALERAFVTASMKAGQLRPGAVR